MMRGGESRARLAAALIALWAVGFELGPGLHVGLHALWGHHDHETARAEVTDHGHDHGPGADHQHGDADKDRDRDPDHGEDSVAHRGLATLGAPPPILVPAPGYLGRADQPLAVADRPLAAHRITARQRGPPA